MSSHFVYIIHSKKLNKYYTGYTTDLEWRLVRHNDGWSKSTKAGIPWSIVYTEEFSLKTEALKREKEIKKRKSSNYIKELIAK